MNVNADSVTAEDDADDDHGAVSFARMLRKPSASKAPTAAQATEPKKVCSLNHNYIVEPILLVKLQGHYFHNGPVRFPEKLTGPLNF